MALEPGCHFHIGKDRKWPNQPEEWTLHSELPCLKLDNCGCDAEPIQFAAESLVGTRIMPLWLDDQVAIVRIRLEQDYLFDFRAVNRLVDAETAFQLVHLLSHLSTVAFKFVSMNRVEGIPLLRLNPALLQRVSDISTPQHRRKFQGPLFQLKSHIILHYVLKGEDVDEVLATLRQFTKTRRLTINLLGGERHVHQALSVISEWGKSASRPINDLGIFVEMSLYSDFVDSLVEVDHYPPHTDLFQSHSSCCPMTFPV